MTIRLRDQQELDQLYAEYGERYGGRKEDYFPLLYLRKKFKCDVEEVAHQVTFGNHNAGIDAYYLDRAARNLYLYQFEWSEDYNLFKPALERLTKEGLARVFGTASPGVETNPLLRYLRADLRECRALIDRVYMRFVFKGDVDAADNSAGLAERIESLEARKSLVDAYFRDRAVDLIFEFIADKPGLEVEPRRDTYTLPFTSHVSVQTADGDKTMHLGLLALMDLHCIYRNLGQKFIDRNIRAGLSPENLPNRKVREALAAIVLEGSESPEVFAFNHNGITLSAAQVEFGDGVATIQAPRLLNGAQTLVSLSRFLEDHAAELADEAHRRALAAIHVLAKIVVCDDREFVTHVTICNNQQNPVEAWNLRANDRIGCDLQDKFKEELGLFYSRQENAFDQLSDAEKEELGIQEPRDLKIKLLAQALLAAQGEVERMSRLPDVFESPRLYRETFRENYLQCDARKIVLAYKIQLMLNGPLQRLAERTPGRLQHSIGRARNLVWALLIQALLNSPELPALLERFGGSLARETAFREYLQELAVSKLSLVLRDVVADVSYNAKLGEGKYSFLQSKEIFKRCMEVAHDKHGWVKKAL